MLNANRYFKHQLKAYMRPMIIIIAVVLLIGSGVCSINQYSERELHYSHDRGEYVPADHRYYGDTGSRMTAKDLECYEIHDLMLGYPVTIMMIMCAVAPGWMFSIFKKKRNLDCFYSLPISRRTLGMLQYGLGLIAVYLPFLLAYAQALLCNMSGGHFGNLGHKYILYHFLVSVTAGFVIYTLFSFVFNLANSSGDGYIFMIAYQIVPLFLIGSIDGAVKAYERLVNPSGYTYYSYFNEEYGCSYSFFGELLSDLCVKAERKYPEKYLDKSLADPEVWTVFVIWIVVGALALYGLYRIFAVKKAEQTEEMSETVFGYKTLIPICAVAGILSGFGNDFYYGLMYFVAAVIGYTVYRRGVKYKKSDAIVLALLFAFNLTMSVVNYSMQ